MATEMKEAEVLRRVLAYLKSDSRVAWAARINSGALKVENRFLRFGFPGCPDILGQLIDGRILAVECKSTAKSSKLRPQQKELLEKVNANNGVGIVARSVTDIQHTLHMACPS